MRRDTLRGIPVPTQDVLPLYRLWTVPRRDCACKPLLRFGDYSSMWVISGLPTIRELGDFALHCAVNQGEPFVLLILHPRSANTLTRTPATSGLPLASSADHPQSESKIL